MSEVRPLPEVLRSRAWEDRQHRQLRELAAITIERQATRITALEKENAELRAERDHYAKGEMAAVEKGQEHFHRANAAEEALEKIIDRSHNGELGTSKVIDMRTIAERALTMEDIHREQREVPRLRPARPRKPSEAEGREG